MFKFTDPEPLSGPGHDHFGFNDWEVPVCFDNVKSFRFSTRVSLQAEIR